MHQAYYQPTLVFLEPLPAGKHDVNLKVSVLNPIEPGYNYSADWTYHLNVVPSNSKQGLHRSELYYST